MRRIISDEKLAEAVKSSTSIMGVLRLLGLSQVGGTHAHYSRRIKRLNLDTTHFNLGRGWSKGRVLPERRKSADDVLVILPEGSPRPRREQLLRSMMEKGFEYKCSGCSIKEWMGKPITLDIDHIDGNWLNNLEENLRFLCPNCHSQTETFGFKKRITHHCECGSEVSRQGKDCRSCASRKKHEANPKFNWPSVEEVTEQVRLTNFSQAGKILGVSDNAIRKFLKKNGVDLKSL